MTPSEARQEAPKPLAIRGPLALIGVVLGLLAAGSIAPGCSFTEAEVERLHVGMPIAMPIALVFAATVLGARLAPKPMEPKRRWILLAGAMTLLGETMFSITASLLYAREILSDCLTALLFFWPVHVPLFLVSILLVGAAREAARVRPVSLVAGVLRRQVWLVVLAALPPITAVIAIAEIEVALGPAHAAGAISAAAIPVMAIFLIADVRAVKRIDRVIGRSRAASREEVTEPLDLGVGDELSIIDPADAAQGYRDAGPRGGAVLGAPDRARALIVRARTRTAIALGVGIVATAIGAKAISTLRPPPPVEPSPSFGGVWTSC